MIFFSLGTLKQKLGSHSIKWNSCGTEGWIGDIYELQKYEYGSFSLLAKLKKKQEGNKWWITYIYGPSWYLGNLEFLVGIKWTWYLIDEPWCVARDFIEILFSMDRKGSRIMPIISVSWVDISFLLSNLQHTWSNFRTSTSRKKIDRNFVKKEWLAIHPIIYLRGLWRPVSNHCPILAEIDCPDGGSNPFRFRNIWLQHKDFKQNI